MGNSPQGQVMPPSEELKQFLTHVLKLDRENLSSKNQLGCFWIVNPEKQSGELRKRYLILRYLMMASDNNPDQTQQISFIQNTFRTIFGADSPDIDNKLEQNIFDWRTKNRLLWLTIQQLNRQKEFNLNVFWSLRLLITTLMKSIKRPTDVLPPAAAFFTFYRSVELQPHQIDQLSQSKGKILEFLSFFYVQTSQSSSAMPFTPGKCRVLIKINVSTKEKDRPKYGFIRKDHSISVFNCLSTFEIVSCTKHEQDRWILVLNYWQPKKADINQLQAKVTNKISELVRDIKPEQKDLLNKEGSVGINQAKIQHQQDKDQQHSKKLQFVMYFLTMQKRLQMIEDPDELWLRLGEDSLIIAKGKQLRCKGHALMKKCSYLEANKYFNEALSLQPTDPFQKVLLNHQKAICLQKFSKYREAILLYRQNSALLDTTLRYQSYQRVINRSLLAICLCQSKQQNSVIQARKIMLQILRQVIQLDNFQSIIVCLRAIGICEMNIDSSILARLSRQSQSTNILNNIKSAIENSIRILTLASTMFNHIFKPLEQAETLVYLANAQRMLKQQQQSQKTLFKAYTILQRYCPEQSKREQSQICSKINQTFGRNSMDINSYEDAINNFTLAIKKLPCRESRAGQLHILLKQCYVQLKNAIKYSQQEINASRCFSTHEKLSF